MIHTFAIYMLYTQVKPTATSAELEAFAFGQIRLELGLGDPRVTDTSIALHRPSTITTINV